MDGNGLARDIKRRSPNTFVISRIYNNDEGNFHRLSKGAAKNYAEARWNEIEREGNSENGKRLIDSVYLFNEPTFGNSDPRVKEDYQRLVDAYIYAMDWADPRGLSLSGPNLGVGTVDYENWDIFDPLIERHSKNTNHVFALHEYFAALPNSGMSGANPEHNGTIMPSSWPKVPNMVKYHCGRGVDNVLLRCTANNWEFPRIAILEHGADRLQDVEFWLNTLKINPGYDTQRGWRSLAAQYHSWFGALGWSAEQSYFEMMHYLDQYLYGKTYNHGRGVIGQTVYCYGWIDKQWEQFDIENAVQFQTLNEEYAKMDTPPTYVVPGVNDPRWVSGTLAPKDAQGTNMRSEPMIANNVIGTLKTPVYVDLIPKAFENWSFVRFYSGTIKNAWISGDWIVFTPDFAPDTLGTVLDVDYLTQVGTGYNNCLPACLAMAFRFYGNNNSDPDAEILRTLTVKQVADIVGNNGEFANLDDGIRAATILSVPLESRSQNPNRIGKLDVSRIADKVSIQKSPVIPLVNRGKLPDRHFYKTFEGPHFILVAGHTIINGVHYFGYFDPLNFHDRMIWIDSNTLNEALLKTPPNSYDYAGLAFPDWTFVEKPDDLPDEPNNFRVVWRVNSQGEDVALRAAEAMRNLHQQASQIAAAENTSLYIHELLEFVQAAQDFAAVINDGEIVEINTESTI